MKPEDVKEIGDIIIKWFKGKNYDNSIMMSFFASSIASTFAAKGCDIRDFEQFLMLMKNAYYDHLEKK